MGKDKTKDGDATTSTKTNRDHSWDQEARDATLAKTIAKAVTRETQTIAEVFAREMAKAHVQYQATIKENCAKTYHQPLKLLLDRMVLESWTPLTGQWTKLSTRDGNCGHIRLDSPLMPWRETQRIPKSLIFTTGSMEKGSQRLKDGKTTKSSSASQTMMH